MNLLAGNFLLKLKRRCSATRSCARLGCGRSHHALFSYTFMKPKLFQFSLLPFRAGKCVLKNQRRGPANRYGARMSCGRSHHSYFCKKFIKPKYISLFFAPV